MNRTIYKKLLDWRQKSAGKTALMLDGALRVGKSLFRFPAFDRF